MKTVADLKVRTRSEGAGRALYGTRAYFLPAENQLKHLKKEEGLQCSGSWEVPKR